MFADRHFTRSGRWHPAAVVSADTTAPTISTGPTVSSITDTSATVSWTLDEAATGQVGYGLLEPGGTGAVAIADSDIRTGASLYVTIPKSALSIQAGDVVVIIAGKPQRAQTFSEVGSTSGWNFAYNAYYDSTEKQTAMLAYKRISSPTSEPASWEFTRGPTESIDEWSAITLVLRGVETEIEDAALTSSTGADDFTPDAPDITTVTDGALVLTCHYTGARSDLSSSSAGAPSGFTLLPKAAQVNSWLTVAYKTESSAGAKSYGVWTHSPDEATAEYQVFTIAIKPSGSGGGAWSRISEYTSQSDYDGSYGTSKSLTLTGLSPDTTYHYAVESLDAAGNVVVSSDDTFATTAGGGGDPGGFPTPQTGTTYVAWGGSLSEPGYLSETADPNFEGSITRISPSDGADWHVGYPRRPVWNADESAMIVYRNGTPYLLDGQTYANEGSLSGVISSRTYWSATDSRYAWTSWQGQNVLYRANPQAGTRSVYRTFSAYSSVNHGIGEGRPSNDDRYHALWVDNSTTVLIYDAQADTYRVVTVPDNDIDWVGMSPSGAYLLVDYRSTGTMNPYGTYAYNTADGSVHRHVGSGSHCDVVQDANGNDMIVHFAGSPIRVRATRISDGANFDVSFGAQSSGHVSGTSFQRPGYVSLSSHYNREGDPGWDQLISCKVDGSIETEVWAHARTYQTTSQYTYALSTFGVVSPTGTRMAWGGGWQRSTTGTSVSHAYVVRIAP